MRVLRVQLTATVGGVPDELDARLQEGEDAAFLELERMLEQGAGPARLRTVSLDDVEQSREDL
jgi:hypothetical protein